MMAALLVPAAADATPDDKDASGAPTSFAERSLKWTPLHVAVFRRESASRVLELAAATPKSQATTALGQTALHIAALANADAGVADALLRLGLDPNARDAFQRTPLQVFCERRPHALPVALVQALLRGGADPNLAALRKRTPLLACADRRASPELVEALVAAGARLDARDNTGHTPLQIAERRVLQERNMRFADWHEWARLLVLLSGGVQARTLAEGKFAPKSAAYILATKDGDRRIFHRIVEMLIVRMPRARPSRYF